MLVALALLAAGCAWKPPVQRVLRLDPPPDAGTDDTAWLQAELDLGGTLILPRLPGGRCYRVRGLWVTRSDTTLRARGACLRALGPGPVRRSSGDGDPIAATAILFVNRTRQQRAQPERIRLEGLRLVVPRETGMHGISILGRDVRVERVRVEGHPVDGILVGGRAEGEFAHDVVIASSRLLGASRNAVSATGVVGLVVERSFIAGAVSDPGAGIDLEPDNADDPILDVRIADNRLLGNGGAGILLAFETPSGPPLRADRIEIAGNRIADNGGAGIHVVGGSRNSRGVLTLTGNRIAGNAGAALAGRTTLLVRARGNDLRGNGGGGDLLVKERSSRPAGR